jgi:hypothetical protein
MDTNAHESQTRLPVEELASVSGADESLAASATNRLKHRDRRQEFTGLDSCLFVSLRG